MRDILDRLFDQQTLSRQEAYDTLCAIAAKHHNESQVAAFLAAFRMRCLTVQELEGFRAAMLDLCLAVDVSGYDTIDLCGTGGDGKDTFNISTLTSFVVAGAGIKVTKHGNYGVSSICGSSNVLSHLGIKFTNNHDILRRSLDEAGICYLHAPLFHPAMKEIAPIRRALGVRTFFNVLGPLVNPARPKAQLSGVFSLELARLYHYLLQRQAMRYTIIHALDGYDEISLTGAFKVMSQEGEEVLTPEQIGRPRVAADAITGGADIATSAALFLGVLEGRGSEAQTQVVLTNTAFAIRCAQPQHSLTDAFAMAQESLQAGHALQAFRTLQTLYS